MGNDVRVGHLFSALPSVRFRRGVADELVIKPNDVQIVVDRDAFIDSMKTFGVPAS